MGDVTKSLHDFQFVNMTFLIEHVFITSLLQRRDQRVEGSGGLGGMGHAQFLARRGRLLQQQVRFTEPPTLHQLVTRPALSLWQSLLSGACNAKHDHC